MCAKKAALSQKVSIEFATSEELLILQDWIVLGD